MTTEGKRTMLVELLTALAVIGAVVALIGVGLVLPHQLAELLE